MDSPPQSLYINRQEFRESTNQKANFNSICCSCAHHCDCHPSNAKNSRRQRQQQQPTNSTNMAWIHYILLVAAFAAGFMSRPHVRKFLKEKLGINISTKKKSSHTHGTGSASAHPSKKEHHHHSDRGHHKHKSSSEAAKVSSSPKTAMATPSGLKKK